MIGNTKHRQGFTLLETLTALAIFALTVVAALNLYLVFFRSQTQVKRQAVVESDARFVLQSMISALETATLDYDYYGGTAPITPTELALITPHQETVRFRYDSTDREVEVCSLRSANDPCSDADSSHWVALNNPAVSPVVALNLWVAPAQNPFERVSGSALSNEQPKVTIVLYMTDQQDGNPITLQTTFTSRVYER